MEQNDRLEKNKDFFQGKELFNTKLLPKKEDKNEKNFNGFIAGWSNQLYWS